MMRRWLHTSYFQLVQATQDPSVTEPRPVCIVLCLKTDPKQETPASNSV